MADEQIKLEDILEDISGALYGVILDSTPGNPKPNVVQSVVSKLMQQAGLTGSPKSAAAAALEFLEGRKTLTIDGKPFRPEEQESVRRQVLEENEGAIESLRRKSLSPSQVKAATQQAILDRYLERLARQGIDAKRPELLEAIRKDSKLRGILKQQIVKDQDGKDREYDVIENDFIEVFVASQLRSRLSPPKPKKFASKKDKDSGTVSPKYQKADEESKRVNSILGEMGFAVSSQAAGGVTRGVALKIRTISMETPEVAAMLLSILTYDGKGKLRTAQGIRNFESDWRALVNAVAKTPVGSVEERITEALVALGDKAKRWATRKDIPFAPVFDKEGAVDIDKTLSRYRAGSREYRDDYKLAATLTLPKAEEAVGKVKSQREKTASRKAATAQRKLDSQKRKSNKVQKELNRKAEVSLAVAEAKILRSKLGMSPTETTQEFLAKKIARLKEIKSKLSAQFETTGLNLLSDVRKRQALADESLQIMEQIRDLTRLSGFFSGLKVKQGVERASVSRLAVRVTDKQMEQVVKLVALTSDPETTKLTLSQKQQLELERKFVDALKSAKIDLTRQEAELILGNASAVMPITDEVAAQLITAAKQTGAAVRKELDKIKRDILSGARADSKEGQKALTRGEQDAISKIFSKTIKSNSALQQFKDFASAYLKAASKEFLAIDPNDTARREAFAASFHGSYRRLIEAERMLLSSLRGGRPVSDAEHIKRTTFEQLHVELFYKPGQANFTRVVNVTKSGAASGESAASVGVSATGQIVLGMLSGNLKIYKAESIEARQEELEKILPGFHTDQSLARVAALLAGAAKTSGGQILTAEEIEKNKAEEAARKSTRNKEALEAIRKILAGDKAAFSDPREMLKLVSYISGTRSGKLTATNFIQSLLQKISDKDKVGATPEQLASLAKLMRVLSDGTISGPKTGAITKAGGRDLLDIADKLLKGISPGMGRVIEPGQELASSISGALINGAEMFKSVTGKKLQKTLTNAATEAEEKLAQAEKRRANKAADGEAASPRARSARGKLGELTQDPNTGQFVDAKGRPLGFKGKGFADPIQGTPKQSEKALGEYLVKQGLIAKPGDLVMKPGEGRGSKPIIDLEKSTFVSEAAKAIAGIVQDVRAKAMKIDPQTGAKVSSKVADSIAGLLEGPKKGGVGSSGPIGRALAAAIDEVMADPTVKRTFTRGGVKMEQTAPEYLKEQQDKAAAKGQSPRAGTIRKRFVKAFKGEAATAVAARLGIDVAPGVDPGKAIAENLAAAKAAKAQAKQESDQAEEEASRVRALKKKVLSRQLKLGRKIGNVGGELAEGQPGPATTKEDRANIARQHARSMPLHERRAAYAQMGLSGAPAQAAGGAPQGQAFTGQGMQFVPGATIAIPQVDIGPLKELASQMAEVGKSLALIPKATIPKGMSASLKEIASLMQVLATVKSPPKGANVSAFKKLIQDLNALASAFGGKAPNTKNVGNIIAALRSVNKILDALSAIGTKMPAKTLLSNMQEFKKSLQFIPKMFSALGNMDFAAISNVGATIAATKFPSQQRLAGINEALLMIKQILETANSMKGGRMPTITGGATGGGRFLVNSPTASRIRARQAALAERIQGPGFGRHGPGDRFGSGRTAAVRAIPLRQRLDYYDQARAEREAAAASRGQRPPRERPARTGSGGGGGRDRGYSAPAGQFGMPRQIGGPMGPQISTGGVQQFSNDAMGILGNLAQQIRFGFTQEVTREIAQSFGRVLAHLKDGIIKFNSTLETATVAFQTLFENEQKAEGMQVNFKKAKEEAEGLVQQLKTFANVTPFRFPQLAESARRMRAFGFETEEIIPNMQAIGDAVAALGGEDDKIFRITYALGQMRQAGRVYQNDMMQLANAGIAGYDILSKALLQDFVKLGKLSLNYNGEIIDQTTIQAEGGYQRLVAAINAATSDATRSQVKVVSSTSSEIANIFDRVSKDPIEAIRDLTQSGQIAGGAAASAIIEGLGQEYGGGMRKLAKTFDGAFSTLSDVTQAFVADITRPVFESIRDEMIDLGTFLQSIFVANIVKNVAKGFAQIVGPVQEVIGSLYSAITAVLSGIIKLFGEFTGAFSLLDKTTVKFVDGFRQVTYTFEKTKGAGQDFIARIGGGIKMIADLMQFPLAKGLVGAALGFKVLSAAFNMNPMLLTLTALTVGLTFLKDFLSTDVGKPFADTLSGVAASLTALARNFKQEIMPVLQQIMTGIGMDFVGALVLSISLMIPVLKQVLILLNTMLELMNAIPFLPTLMGMAIGLSLLRKMVMPLKNIVMGVPATMDARGNPIAATKGILGTLESAVTRITAKLLPMTTLVNRAPTEALRRLAPQVPVGTLGAPGRPSAFGAVAGGVEKVLVQPAQKKMLSSQMLKQLLGSGVIKQAEYEAAMAARRAAMEAAARAGTGPGGISGLRELARTGGGTKAALGALGNVFADPTLNTTVRINSLVESIKAMFKAFRNLNLVIGSINKVKFAGNAIGNLFKSIALAAKSIPKAAITGINRLMKSLVLASALKVNSSIWRIVPKVFVPFMEQIKTTGPRGTGGDLISQLRRARAAGMDRAGRLALAGRPVPFAMPRQGVTSGPIGYLARAMRGFRPNRLLESPAPTGVAQKTGVINRTIQAVVQRIPTQVPVGTLGAPGRPSGFGAIAGRIERVLVNATQGRVAQNPGRIRPQVLGGSPSFYGVSIFKVIQERIKYLAWKIGDTAGLYTARITTALEKSFLAFDKMMRRLAGAPARIFTMQNFDKIITRYAEAMVRAFTPKTAPMAGFLAGGTKKAPTELFRGLKDAIARRVIPNTIVGRPGPTFTDKIFAGADKLAKVSERFAEMMVKGFAPKTVPIEKFLAGGTARVPKELFAGLKDAIARIVIPDKFTQPISLFQRAVMFFKNAASGFAVAVKGLASSTAGAGGNILSKFGTSIIGGGGALLAAMRASKGMAIASSSIKAVGTGIMGAVNKIGKFNILLSALLTGNTIRERIGAEGDKNAGAIVGQEGVGLAGALIGGRVIGGAITARIGTAVGALGGPIGMILGTIVGQVIGSFLGGLVFPGQEVTPAEQEKSDKAAAIDDYMQDGIMNAQEFLQLITDFNFTPQELLTFDLEEYKTLEGVISRIKEDLSTTAPALGESVDNLLQGLGTKADEKLDEYGKPSATGTSYTEFATAALEKIRAAIANYYQNLGSNPAEAMAIAQNEMAMYIAALGQVKTIDDANALLQQYAKSWQINIDGVKGFGLYIGGANNNLEKLQTNLEKIRSEFQKLAARLQSRINAVFEQQMEKALEKAKDAFLATQMVMVEGSETNLLALREEIEATEKRNKLLSIEKKLRDAARSVEMAKLGQYDASMDPLEAASRMREAQEAQTEAVKEAALERKKIALEEAMASDPVVAGLQDVDERFEAARMKFQEGMEDILELVEAGKLTGTQAAAKIKELYTSVLGEVGVLDANLDVDAKNFGDSFLGTWETILKKFETIVTKLKKALAAIKSYTNTNEDDNPKPSTAPANDQSTYGGRAKDNWQNFGMSKDEIAAADKALADAQRTNMSLRFFNMLKALQNAQMPNNLSLSQRAAWPRAISSALAQFSVGGQMYDLFQRSQKSTKPDAIAKQFNAGKAIVDKIFWPYGNNNPIAGMASGGTIMGEGGMFRVGEAGRETLQVVPGGVARVFPRRIRPISQIGMAGGSGGGINASVIINNPTVRSDQDIRKLADAVGKAQSSLLRSAGIGRI